MRTNYNNRTVHLHNSIRDIEHIYCNVNDAIAYLSTWAWGYNGDTGNQPDEPFEDTEVHITRYVGSPYHMELTATYWRKGERFYTIGAIMRTPDARWEYHS